MTAAPHAYHHNSIAHNPTGTHSVLSKSLTTTFTVPWLDPAPKAGSRMRLLCPRKVNVQNWLACGRSAIGTLNRGLRAATGDCIDGGASMSGESELCMDGANGSSQGALRPRRVCSLLYGVADHESARECDFSRGESEYDGRGESAERPFRRCATTMKMHCTTRKGRYTLVKSECADGSRQYVVACSGAIE